MTCEQYTFQLKQDVKRLSPDFLRQWQGLISKTGNLDKLYQSPCWFEHLLSAHGRGELFLWTLRNGADELCGVVPGKLRPHWIKFSVRGKSYLKIPITVFDVLGSHALLPDDSSACDVLFQNLCGSLPGCDALYFDCVITDSFLWRYFQAANWKKFDLNLYTPDGPQPYHYLRLPGTFDEYLAGFKRKKRYNLKRQVKTLKDIGGERYRFWRITSGHEVENFLEHAEKISRRSWQHQRIGERIICDENTIRRFKSLADKGILRSYLLQCGETCAFVIGYQYQRIFYYIEIAYDRKFARYSPGTILLYLIIEDLIEDGPFSYLNFGVGHAGYKQLFGSHHLSHASVYLVDRTIRNLLTVYSHRAFRFVIRQLRAFLKKK